MNVFHLVLSSQVRRHREKIMKDLEEAAEEQNPLGLLPPSAEDGEDVAAAAFGYTVSIPSRGLRNTFFSLGPYP